MKNNTQKIFLTRMRSTPVMSILPWKTTMRSKCLSATDQRAFGTRYGYLKLYNSKLS